jgi:hypothetical protein
VEGIAGVNTITLILAAGDAARMDGVKKQLLPIGDTTILERTLSQVRQYGQRAIVVTHDDEIAEVHDRTHNPKKRGTVCETLLSTAHLWDDKTIVLLGDVVYSDYAMGLIMNCHEQIRVFGNVSEIFAIVFNKRKHGKIKTALRKGSKHRRGKLRYFYHAYCGFDMDAKGIGGRPLEHVVFYTIRDWTRDIDTPHHHERLLLEIVNEGILQ